MNINIINTHHDCWSRTLSAWSLTSLTPSDKQDVQTYQNDFWQRLLGEKPGEIDSFLRSLTEKYPDRPLIPFARFEDSANGDVACFDGHDTTGDPKIYFHVYGYQKTVPAWDKRYQFKNFDEWMKTAREESKRYRAEHGTR